jgi:hypothetical protein
MAQLLKPNRSDNRGGSNRNQGAKPKYNEPTTTIAFRVPLSLVNEIKHLVKEQLKQKLNTFEL